MRTPSRYGFKVFALLSIAVLVIFLVINRAYGQQVGAKVGDWIKHDVSSEGPIKMPDWDKEWVQTEVQNVSSGVVTILQRTHFRDGNETTETMTADLRSASVNTFLIGTGHNLGDSVDIEGYGELLISNQVSSEYGGVTREVLTSTYSFVTSFFGDQLNGTQQYCWDKETGWLLETHRTAFIIGYENTTFSKWSMEIVDTNVWKMEANSQPVLTQLGLVVAMVAFVCIVLGFGVIRRKQHANEKTLR